MAVLSRLAIAAGLACSILGQQTPLSAPSSREPAQTAVGGVTADVTKPIVDSETLQASIKIDALMKRAEKLYQIAEKSEHDYNHPTRVIGSAGHKATVKYVLDELKHLGNYYKVSTQEFPVTSGSVHESRLTVGDEVLKSATPMGLTPATKDNEPVTGDLVLIANQGCQPTDFPAQVKGNIALILRGNCPFGDKSSNAGKAGAVAAIIYNTDDDGLNGTLGDPIPEHVATFGIPGVAGKAIANRLSHGETIPATAYIDAELKKINTTNVIAQTSGGDPNNVVALGAHSDSVGEGPGINDDGSGTISLLEVATQLTKYKVNNAVRFAWWAAEEEGLLGSNWYANHLSEEENLKIRLFMDYDMMASPNFAYQIYDSRDKENPAGSQALRDLYIDWYTKQGLNYTFIEFDGRSDYVGFIEHGIPASGIATGAEGIKTEEEAKVFGGVAGAWYDPCYHQLCDDVGNVNTTAFEVNTKLIAHSVATYALSLEDFPKRTEAKTATMAQKKKTPFKYRGPKLVA
ncbi:Aminopeptidase Y [Escovopsis weberi]|uniref:Peptide hydrolase n=1 Tax=Escovopsis weberi TaxID=150374 RepID=A0A0M9VWK1_ESCWE|nr:Aminopeptidase Y [Escovopsis weberi]